METEYDCTKIMTLKLKNFERIFHVFKFYFIGIKQSIMYNNNKHFSILHVKRFALFRPPLLTEVVTTLYDETQDNHVT